MGLGVLEVASHADVHGTSHLHERQTTLPSDAEVSRSSLKYDRNSGTPILLVPQPTDDPSDPLNQPLWRRDLQLFVLCLVGVLATTLSPILAANSLSLAFYFLFDFTKIALLTGWHLLAVALSGIFFIPSARIFGKRHLYLLGTALVIASTAWAGASGHNYTSLVWARVVQGIALAPFEALVNVSVGDLFFVHQRGKRMALSNLALFGGAFFTPVIAGKITDTLGWPWTFYLVAIFTGALFPVVVFFSPETAYRRPAELMNPVTHARRTDKDIPMDDKSAWSSRSTTKDMSEHAVRQTSDTSQTALHSQRQRVSYARSLLPFNGRKTDESFFKLCLRPLPLFVQPGILWACLIQGTLIGWTVLIGIVLAALVLGPPLFFESTQVGYMYSSAFIGALCGFAISGLLADSSAKWMTRWNSGVYEPEFRMILVVPQLVLGSIGLYGFGFTAADTYRYGWIGPCVFFGFEVAGMVCGAVASGLYIVDAHADIAIECFTCLLIFKNIFSFGLTYHGYDWLIKNGTHATFNIVASVQVGVCMTTILMYVFGKWNRSFWARHDLLDMLNLK